MEKDLKLYQVDNNEEIVTEVEYNSKEAYNSALNMWEWVGYCISNMPYEPVAVVETLEEALKYGYPIYDEFGVELYCSEANNDPNAIS